METKIRMFTKAMAKRKNAEQSVQMTPPTPFSASKRDWTAAAAKAMATDMTITTVE